MASEYLKWKYRDVKPDEPIQYTAEQRRRNWWHYHKWHVVIAAVLIVALGDIFWNALGIGKLRPDYQIAYVGSAVLPGDTVSALENALARLGRDANGDGRVVVKLNQYAIGGGGEGDSDAALYAYAASTTLMADLEARESYFFLLEAPDGFQRSYQVLRRLDGSLPGDFDRDYESCCLAWTDCPALTALDLGGYSETVLGQKVSGDNQALLSRLYIARRGFWTEQTTDYPDACDALWTELTKGAF